MLWQHASNGLRRKELRTRQPPTARELGLAQQAAPGQCCAHLGQASALHGPLLLRAKRVTKHPAPGPAPMGVGVTASCCPAQPRGQRRKCLSRHITRLPAEPSTIQRGGCNAPDPSLRGDAASGGGCPERAHGLGEGAAALPRQAAQRPILCSAAESPREAGWPAAPPGTRLEIKACPCPVLAAPDLPRQWAPVMVGGSHQRVDARQRVVGVIQGIEQLGDAIVGLAVPVEADADGSAVGKRNAVVWPGLPLGDPSPASRQPLAQQPCPGTLVCPWAPAPEPSPLQVLGSLLPSSGLDRADAAARSRAGHGPQEPWLGLCWEHAASSCARGWGSSCSTPATAGAEGSREPDARGAQCPRVPGTEATRPAKQITRIAAAQLPIKPAPRLIPRWGGMSRALPGPPSSPVSPQPGGSRPPCSLVCGMGPSQTRTPPGHLGSSPTLPLMHWATSCQALCLPSSASPLGGVSARRPRSRVLPCGGTRAPCNHTAQPDTPMARRSCLLGWWVQILLPGTSITSSSLSPAPARCRQWQLQFCGRCRLVQDPRPGTAAWAPPRLAPPTTIARGLRCLTAGHGAARDQGGS